MTDHTDPLDSILTVLSERIAASGTSLYQAADAERITPLLYYEFLRHGFPETLSVRERASFRKAYYHSAGNNVELLSALADVATALTEHGVSCVAFKGADLAKRLYPNVALRPMGDVDVYVAPKHAERAEDVLTRIGYRPWTPEMTPGLSRRIRHARLYTGGPADAVSIDLHWSLVGHGDDQRAPERDWIDRHTRRSGEPWQRLSETAHLLYLAAHMKLQHYDEEIPLLWLIDFHCLACSGNIDWDELFDDGARFGWTEAVAACAFDVRERLGVTLPPPLHRVARAPSASLHASGARNQPERVWNELTTLPWSGRFALARAYVLPSPSYVRFRYPPRVLPTWTWPIGYFKRWVTVVFKGLSMATRMLTGQSRGRPLLTSRETC